MSTVDDGSSRIPFFLRRGLLLVAGNSLVAVLLVLSGFSGGFPLIWAVSQILGCSIGVSCHVLAAVWKRGRPWMVILAGGLLGVAIGKVILAAIGMHGVGGYVLGNREAGLRLTALALLFTGVFGYLMYARKRIQGLETARREAEMVRIQQENAALAAHLQMLQAQIEPHFLFNTLANLHSLITVDPLRARTLLERIDAYLRVSLTHSRAKERTLDQECDLLRTYLDIQSMRMGRLAWSFDIPASLMALPFPPMLLQPLVENAVVRGLEPKVGPGRIEIAASLAEGMLRVAVRDDGVGVGSGAPGRGMGIASVRDRLRALYGTEARLEMRANTMDPDSGVTSELWIPAPPAP